MRHITRLAVAASVAAATAACGSKMKTTDATGHGAYGNTPEATNYEIQCATQPPPAAPSGASATDPMSIPLPDKLPQADTPIEVQSCDALGGQPPHFFGRTMPGIAVVVDCNAKVVRFRTRDWQVSETAMIGPAGDVTSNVMLIDRLVSDTGGNSSCWVRLLGHISGTVDCSGGPAAAHMNLRTEWRMDKTPPEVMEPPAPGLADLRNGPHCALLSGDCRFSNTMSAGCGG